MNIDKICLGCMSEIITGNRDTCPRCGYKINSENPSRGLQPQTVLNGKYLVGRVIGEGGFGITYIGFDLILNSRVAIKEYFPVELASRDTSTGIQTSLSVLTGSKEEQYKKGIERFVNEASNLAKFNNLPGIVSVRDFFYENNTAYMVMEYIDGVTLTDYLKQYGEKLSYRTVISMMKPVMNSLQKVHEAGIIHRDISPDNIMVSKEGEVKLIDFGAARFVGNEDQKSLTVILKHGYAPEEQYQTNGKQGPWTDVYALAATMYRMITGIVPQEATERILSGDKVAPVNKIVSDVPRSVSDAIMRGMAAKSSIRFKTIEDFSKDLTNERKISKWQVITLICATVLLAIIAVVIKTALVGKNDSKDIDILEEEIDKGKANVGDNNNDVELKEDGGGTKDRDSEEIDEVFETYMAFFNNNYILDEEADYYIYFYDLENNGVDNMIVVHSIFSDDTDDIIGYKQETYSYRDGKVSKIYETESLKTELTQTGFGSYAKSGLCYVIFEGDNAYLCEARFDKRWEFHIFDFDINGKLNEYKEIYDDSLLEMDIDNVGKPNNAIISNAISLYESKTIFDDSEDKNGICLASNHDYRKIITEKSSTPIKKIDKSVIETNIENTNLSTVIIEDFNGDGNEERVETHNDGGTYYRNGDDLILIGKGEARVVQFGKNKQLILGYSAMRAENSAENKSVSYFTFDGNGFSKTDTKGKNIFIDIKGRPYILDTGDISRMDELDQEYIKWNDACHKFYLTWQDDEYVEYDSVRISMSDLQVFDNIDEILENIENKYSDNENLKFGIKEILYSSNDMLYINYLIEKISPNNEYQGEGEWTYVLEIEDSLLSPVDWQEFYRKEKSESGFKSYTQEFPFSAEKVGNEDKNISNSHIIAVRASSELAEYDMVHSAERICDNDISTAWVEGVEGNGIGESVYFEFDDTYKVGGFIINAGYQKTQDLYTKNSRPMSIIVEDNNGNSKEYELKDTFDFQTVIFDSPVVSNGMRITIGNVYPGTKYEDCVISEISLF